MIVILFNLFIRFIRILFKLPKKNLNRPKHVRCTVITVNTVVMLLLFIIISFITILL